MTDNDLKRLKKYAAFISYSEKPSREAENWQLWFEKALSSYPVSPRVYAASRNKVLIKKGRLFKIFKTRRLKGIFVDRKRLLSAENLDEELRQQVNQSYALIVLCSPESKESEYVNKEVNWFRSTDIRGPLIPIIVASSDGKVGEDFSALFPKTLLRVQNPEGETEAVVPNAYDFRMNISGKKIRGFTDSKHAREYYKAETKLVAAQVKVDCEKYQQQKLECIHAIMEQLLDIDAENPRQLLKDEYTGSLPGSESINKVWLVCVIALVLGCLALVGNLLLQKSQVNTMETASEQTTSVQEILSQTKLSQKTLSQTKPSQTKPSQTKPVEECVSLVKYPELAQSIATKKARSELVNQIRTKVSSESSLAIDSAQSGYSYSESIEQRTNEILEGSYIVKKEERLRNNEIHICVTMAIDR